jgi:glucosylceramidase
VASDEPAGTDIKNVAFRNPDKSLVLYVLNAGNAGQDVRIAFRGKAVTATLPGGSITTFVWKP